MKNSESKLEKVQRQRQEKSRDDYLKAEFLALPITEQNLKINNLRGMVDSLVAELEVMTRQVKNCNTIDKENLKLERKEFLNTVNEVKRELLFYNNCQDN